MKQSKQIIVLRKDLNMRKGKMVAQGAHASMKVILDMMTRQIFPTTSVESVFDTDVEVRLLSLHDNSALKDWIHGKFTKICVSVDSEQELIDVYENAKLNNLPCSIIIDSGLTEFNNIPTKTAVAIGPSWSENIDIITGSLKLL